MLDIIKWGWGFWYLRGFSTALALASLFEYSFDLSRFEALRAIRAIILSWNQFVHLLTKLISQIPGFPNLPILFLNATLLVTSLAPGLAFAYRSYRERETERLTQSISMVPALRDELASLQKKHRQAKRMHERAAIQIEIDRKETQIREYLSYTSHIESMRFGEYGSTKRYFLLIVFSIFLIIVSFVSDLFSRNDFFYSTFSLYFLVLFLLACTCEISPSFRYGFLSLLGTLVSVEVLYWIHAPFVRDWVHSLAEAS